MYQCKLKPEMERSRPTKEDQLVTCSGDLGKPGSQKDTVILLVLEKRRWEGGFVGVDQASLLSYFGCIALAVMDSAEGGVVSEGREGNNWRSPPQLSFSACSSRALKIPTESRGRGLLVTASLSIPSAALRTLG